MKFKASHKTESYISVSGYYAIKQEGWPGDESIVLLSPEQLRDLIIDMKEALSESDSWWNQAEDAQEGEV